MHYELIPAAAATIVLVLLGAAVNDCCSQDVEWQLYKNAVAGIQIFYPESWSVIIARERDEPLAVWSAEILEQGELHKITFLQEAIVLCPGQYEIRVLANPENLDLETFYAQFDLSDLFDESQADSTIGDLPAKTWVRWNYDSLIREYLLVIPEGVIHILYDEQNPNDPDFQNHREIYTEMTSSFRVLIAEERKAGGY